MNPILQTDSYKITHWRQYPPGTQHVFSFFESRGGQFDEVVFFGLQYLLKRHLVGEIVTEKHIEEAREVLAQHLGDPSLFNEAGWRRVVDLHGGRLPLEIRAVPEGTAVGVQNVLMTVQNTDPELPWLTNYVETTLVRAWYPTTVCTFGRQNRRVLLDALEETGDPSLVDFKLHDFGYRGVSSEETAAVGGMAHLVHFSGTDTLAGIMCARQYYGADMPAFSIPAAEHSTITAWGKDREGDAYENMLDQFPHGLVAVVSDSYDVFRACRDVWGGRLRDKVLGRDGTLVVRPDSGNPPAIVVEVLHILGEKFGLTTNQKGYKVLNPHVRVIQGDGIDHEMMKEVLWFMKESGWSADNVAFGSGGGMLQKLNRDTQRFAFKCCAVQIDDVWHDVKKDPVTDHGKDSKGGRLKLVKEHGWYEDFYRTVREEDSHLPNELVPVFRDGELLVDHAFDSIRARARHTCDAAEESR